MARTLATLVEKATDEQWETTTSSITWIRVTAANGEVRQVKVGGRKGARFKISFEDRVANQDEVVEPQHDPFTNGLLYRLKGSEPVHPPQQAQDYSIDALDTPRPEAEQMMSFAELRGLLEKHGNAFRAQVAKLNETNLRRLDEIAKELPEAQQPTVAQKSAMDELLRAHRPGGTQPSYADFMRGPQGGGVSAAGTPL